MMRSTKTFAAIAALGAVGLGSYSGLSLADSAQQSLNKPAQVQQLNKNGKQKDAMCGRMMKIKKGKHPGMPMMMHHPMPGAFMMQRVDPLGLNTHKNLTADNAKTIVSAALLMRGRHDLQVGKVTAKTGKRGADLYIVSIVDTKNAVISTVVINSDTARMMPLRPKPPAKKA